MDGDTAETTTNVLTSTMGSVQSNRNDNIDDPPPAVDSVPSSSSDANNPEKTLTNKITDDSISSTSDVEEKSLKMEKSNIEDEAELFANECNISYVATEKITENVEDIVSDLENLLGGPSEFTSSNKEKDDGNEEWFDAESTATGNIEVKKIETTKGNEVSTKTNENVNKIADGDLKLEPNLQDKQNETDITIVEDKQVDNDVQTESSSSIKPELFDMKVDKKHDGEKKAVDNISHISNKNVEENKHEKIIGDKGIECYIKESAKEKTEDLDVDVKACGENKIEKVVDKDAKNEEVVDEGTESDEIQKDLQESKVLEDKNKVSVCDESKIDNLPLQEKLNVIELEKMSSDKKPKDQQIVETKTEEYLVEEPKMQCSSEKLNIIDKSNEDISDRNLDKKENEEDVSLEKKMDIDNNLNEHINKISDKQAVEKISTSTKKPEETILEEKMDVDDINTEEIKDKETSSRSIEEETSSRETKMEDFNLENKLDVDCKLIDDNQISSTEEKVPIVENKTISDQTEDKFSESNHDVKTETNTSVEVTTLKAIEANKLEIHLPSNIKIEESNPLELCENIKDNSSKDTNIESSSSEGSLQFDKHISIEKSVESISDKLDAKSPNLESSSLNKIQLPLLEDLNDEEKVNANLEKEMQLQSCLHKEKKEIKEKNKNEEVSIGEENKSEEVSICKENKSEEVSIEDNSTVEQGKSSIALEKIDESRLESSTVTKEDILIDDKLQVENEEKPIINENKQVKEVIVEDTSDELVKPDVEAKSDVLTATVQKVVEDVKKDDSIENSSKCIDNATTDISELKGSQISKDEKISETIPKEISIPEESTAVQDSFTPEKNNEITIEGETDKIVSAEDTIKNLEKDKDKIITRTKTEIFTTEAGLVSSDIEISSKISAVTSDLAIESNKAMDIDEVKPIGLEVTEELISEESKGLMNTRDCNKKEETTAFSVGSDKTLFKESETNENLDEIFKSKIESTFNEDDKQDSTITKDKNSMNSGLELDNSKEIEDPKAPEEVTKIEIKISQEPPIKATLAGPPKDTPTDLELVKSSTSKLDEESVETLKDNSEISQEVIKLDNVKMANDDPNIIEYEKIENSACDKLLDINIPTREIITEQVLEENKSSAETFIEEESKEKKIESEIFLDKKENIQNKDLELLNKATKSKIDSIQKIFQEKIEDEVDTKSEKNITEEKGQQEKMHKPIEGGDLKGNAECSNIQSPNVEEKSIAIDKNIVLEIENIKDKCCEETEIVEEEKNEEVIKTDDLGNANIQISSEENTKKATYSHIETIPDDKEIVKINKGILQKEQVGETTKDDITSNETTKNIVGKNTAETAVDISSVNIEDVFIPKTLPEICSKEIVKDEFNVFVKDTILPIVNITVNEPENKHSLKDTNKIDEADATKSLVGTSKILEKSLNVPKKLVKGEIVGTEKFCIAKPTKSIDVVDEMENIENKYVLSETVELSKSFDDVIVHPHESAEKGAETMMIENKDVETENITKEEQSTLDQKKAINISELDNEIDKNVCDRDNKIESKAEKRVKTDIHSIEPVKDLSEQKKVEIQNIDGNAAVKDKIGIKLENLEKARDADKQTEKEDARLKLKPECSTKEQTKDIAASEVTPSEFRDTCQVMTDKEKSAELPILKEETVGKVIQEDMVNVTVIPSAKESKFMDKSCVEVKSSEPQQVGALMSTDVVEVKYTEASVATVKDVVELKPVSETKLEIKGMDVIKDEKSEDLSTPDKSNIKNEEFTGSKEVDIKITKVVKPLVAHIPDELMNEKNTIIETVSTDQIKQVEKENEKPVLELVPTDLPTSSSQIDPKHQTVETVVKSLNIGKYEFNTEACNKKHNSEDNIQEDIQPLDVKSDKCIKNITSNTQATNEAVEASTNVSTILKDSVLIKQKTELIVSEDTDTIEVTEELYKVSSDENILIEDDPNTSEDISIEERKGEIKRTRAAIKSAKSLEIQPTEDVKITEDTKSAEENTTKEEIKRASKRVKALDEAKTSVEVQPSKIIKSSPEQQKEEPKRMSKRLRGAAIGEIKSPEEIKTVKESPKEETKRVSKRIKAADKTLDEVKIDDVAVSKKAKLAAEDIKVDVTKKNIPSAEKRKTAGPKCSKRLEAKRALEKSINSACEIIDLDSDETGIAESSSNIQVTTSSEVIVIDDTSRDLSELCKTDDIIDQASEEFQATTDRNSPDLQIVEAETNVEEELVKAALEASFDDDCKIIDEPQEKVDNVSLQKADDALLKAAEDSLKRSNQEKEELALIQAAQESQKREHDALIQAANEAETNRRITRSKEEYKKPLNIEVETHSQEISIVKEAESTTTEENEPSTTDNKQVEYSSKISKNSSQLKLTIRKNKTEDSSILKIYDPKDTTHVEISPSGSETEVEESPIPKLIIKQSQCSPKILSPLKITIKPVMKPEEQTQKSSPKLIIKPIIKPDEDIKEEKHHSPKITIKPIPKPVEDGERCNSPKITIKPLIKPTEASVSPKIKIKPIVKPEEIKEETEERIVLKITKGNIPQPKEVKKDETEKLAKIKLKFSKEGGHAHIVNEEKGGKRVAEEVESDIKKLRVEPIIQPTENIPLADINTPKSVPKNPLVETVTKSEIFSLPSPETPKPETSPELVITPTPRKRGRPRKVPLEVREEFKDPKEDEVLEESPESISGRPKRSCRGPSARTTLGIKPRKPRGAGRARGRGRGAGARGNRVDSPPPKKEKITESKLKLLKEAAITAQVTDSLENQDVEMKLSDTIIIEDSNDDKNKEDDQFLAKPADVVMYEEETRMSADSRAQTPAKHVLNLEGVEESQSSVHSSATTESSKLKRGTRLEVHQDHDGSVVHSPEQLAEYFWGGGGPYMLQEQVAQFLGIKSFKRKYPGISRRTVDMQERDFIRESGLASEHMCDLGLTAVNSADILDIMYSDFQFKYEEYCKHQRDRQTKDITNKQKALSLAASQEKNKLDITQAAVESAAQWNANFNKARKEERLACMDLQTFTINYPKGKAKQLNRPKIGNYPIALVPGQYTDYYKTFTPTELNNLPLNTMLYKPINITNDEDSPSDGSGSESESSSSGSDSSESDSSEDDCNICSPGSAVASKKAVV